MAIGAGDGNAPRLQRLPQRLEHGAAQFRQLIEEQGAAVGERYLARRARMPPPTIAACEAVWCGSRNGRTRVSTPSSSMPATE